MSCPRGAHRSSTKEKNRTQLITSGSKYYRGYDPMTGKELWRLLDDCQVKVPSPVIAHDLFYLSGGNQRGRAFYVVRPSASGDISLPKDELSESVAWRKTRGSPYTPTPIVYGEHLYICNDNGVLTVYNALSGEAIYIHRIGGHGTTFSASPIAAEGRLLIFPAKMGTYSLCQSRAGVRTVVNESNG